MKSIQPILHTLQFKLQVLHQMPPKGLKIPVRLRDRTFFTILVMDYYTAIDTIMYTLMY